MILGWWCAECGLHSTDLLHSKASFSFSLNFRHCIYWSLSNTSFNVKFLFFLCISRYWILRQRQSDIKRFSYCLEAFDATIRALKWFSYKWFFWADLYSIEFVLFGKNYIDSNRFTLYVYKHIYLLHNCLLDHLVYHHRTTLWTKSFIRYFHFELLTATTTKITL